MGITNNYKISNNNYNNNKCLNNKLSEMFYNDNLNYMRSSFNKNPFKEITLDKCLISKKSFKANDTILNNVNSLTKCILSNIKNYSLIQHNLFDINFPYKISKHITNNNNNNQIYEDIYCLLNEKNVNNIKNDKKSIYNNNSNNNNNKLNKKNNNDLNNIYNKRKINKKSSKSITDKKEEALINIYIDLRPLIKEIN